MLHLLVFLSMQKNPIDILSTFWGYKAFRPSQEPVIEAILQKNDVLALLPTGGGKSICFQVPGLAIGGLTLVISPLIALMKKPEWTTVQKAPSIFRFPNGESFTEMQSRMVGALDDIRAKHPGEIVVCVSHADPIKAAVAHAMGTHLDLFQRIVISTCSVSAVAYSMSGPVVLTVNSTGGSLSELRPS